jgi:hypothetical protein
MTKAMVNLTDYKQATNKKSIKQLRHRKLNNKFTSIVMSNLMKYWNDATDTPYHNKLDLYSCASAMKNTINNFSVYLLS